MNLLQKEIWEEVSDPWGVLVGCILIQRAKYDAAKGAWDKIKKWYDSPKKMVRANPQILEGCMENLGLQTVRAKNLINMSKDYMEWEDKFLLGTDASKLSGCGGFAKDCWNVVVLGDLRYEVGDHYLEKWRLWMKDKKRKEAEAEYRGKLI